MSLCFAAISPTSTRLILQGHPYIKDNEGCRPIVIEALKFLCDLDVSDKEVDLTHPLARPRIPHEVR